MAGIVLLILGIALGIHYARERGMVYETTAKGTCS